MCSFVRRISFLVFSLFLLGTNAEQKGFNGLNDVLPHLNRIDKFKDIAIKAAKPVTDKVTTHTYNVMYGLFLLPTSYALRKSDAEKLKFLEIGLGCDMNYGPGASVSVWKKLFDPNFELWEAEYNATCVVNAKSKGQLNGVHTLTGDQGNKDTLASWVKESGGKFQVIIDDGGHKNTQIKNSFDVLFPEALLPGGLYFLEDLFIGRQLNYETVRPIADHIGGWIEQLTIPRTFFMDEKTSPLSFELRRKFPLPHQVEFIFCQFEACVVSKCRTPDCSVSAGYSRQLNTDKHDSMLELLPHHKHIDRFTEIVMKASKTPSDKVTSHTYNVMYGIFLVPIAHALQKSSGKMKMLEIGLGCDMNYGPGASVAVWKKLFGSTVELWEGEYNATCVENAKKKGQLDGVNTVTGDQGDFPTLNRWLTETGGNFHVIIDDGGHQNIQIKNTFDVFFEKALLPGGLYFIEDLQVGRREKFGLNDPAGPMTDIIQAWIEQLIIASVNPQDPPNARSVEMRKKHPLPKQVEFILCQYEACVIGKCRTPDCSPKANPLKYLS